MSARFTIDGSDELETHLACVCEKVATGLRGAVPSPSLEAVLLGGGYGRGEGGVRRTPAGDRPYNDIEFYVCIRGQDFLNQRKFGDALHHLAESLTPFAGIEVEFKITSLDKLCSGPTTMFLYDLAAGHRLLVGEPAAVRRLERHRDAATIPLYESTRLLMNRCTGLLFCAEQLERPRFSGEEADFVGRNHAKAELAFGDVLLASRGLYHWSCRERHQRLKALPDLDPQIAAWHAQGVEFKLHPKKRSGWAADFRPQQQQLKAAGEKLWLQLESRRLDLPFASARDYAFSSINKCPETSSLRNRAVNLKTFGLSAALQPVTRYPRQRLLESLALLLWQPGLLADSEALSRVQKNLRTRETTFDGLVGAYRSLWQKFN